MDPNGLDVARAPGDAERNHPHRRRVEQDVGITVRDEVLDLPLGERSFPRIAGQHGRLGRDRDATAGALFEALRVFYPPSIRQAPHARPGHAPTAREPARELHEIALDGVTPLLERFAEAPHAERSLLPLHAGAAGAEPVEIHDPGVGLLAGIYEVQAAVAVHVDRLPPYL